MSQWLILDPKLQNIGLQLTIHIVIKCMDVLVPYPFDTLLIVSLFLFEPPPPNRKERKIKTLLSNTINNAIATRVFNSSQLCNEMVHTNAKPYQCKYCNKSFSIPADRANTPKRKHTNVNIVAKSFSKPGYRTIHEKIHTKQKPYKCQYCDNHFSNIFKRQN